MIAKKRPFLAVLLVTLLPAAARAEDPPAPDVAAPTVPDPATAGPTDADAAGMPPSGDPLAGTPYADGTSPYQMTDPDAVLAAQNKGKPRQPKRGDFDAGGQVRLPSGPDEDGKFASFNWVALDLVGRYYVLDSVSLAGTIPLAVIKPDSIGGGTVEPDTFGGFALTADVKLPKGPFAPKKYEMEVGFLLTGAFMPEGAMLLSDKDYPLYTGDLKPGVSTGLRTKLKMSSLIDFSMIPLFVYQDGTTEGITAVQLPTSLILRLGSVAALSADLGLYTGDDISFKPSNGGRLALGASLTVKLGPIIPHIGAGFASLLTGGAYPTVKDSFYLDVNVRYAK